jgi:hypothetical protein
MKKIDIFWKNNRDQFIVTPEGKFRRKNKEDYELEELSKKSFKEQKNFLLNFCKEKKIEVVPDNPTYGFVFKCKSERFKLEIIKYLNLFNFESKGLGIFTVSTKFEQISPEGEG